MLDNIMCDPARKKVPLGAWKIFEFFVQCYKHGNTGHIGKGFTRLGPRVA